eukprot:s2091_g13.t1
MRIEATPSTLQMFADGLVGPCYFYVCFFVNNQFRILLEQTAAGSDNLETVFEDNLKRIGKMVAILDTWERPVYLTRIWTVYEQFVASTIQIEVQFVMPKATANQLQREIASGCEGTDRVIDALSQVDSQRAEAWKLEDEETVGFEHVDAHVRDVMTRWIGKVVEQTCRELLNKACAKKALANGDGGNGKARLPYEESVRSLRDLAQVLLRRSRGDPGEILSERPLASAPAGLCEKVLKRKPFGYQVPRHQGGLDTLEDRIQLTSTYGPIESWDVSKVTSMRELFYFDTGFNEDIRAWNTSAVVDMAYMFFNAWTFDQPIGSWDTSAVTNMENMFNYAQAFNQPLSSWNTSSVTNMEKMFFFAVNFNGPVNSWNTAAVTNMESMFFEARAFNQPLDLWNTSAVTSMESLFQGATAFNRSLDSWNTAAVATMESMFYDAKAFNQPISAWNTSSVTNMVDMFYRATAFNQPIDSWDTSAVTTMERMFFGATAFNQPLESWDTSAVANMDYMFYGAKAFDQPIGSWLISSLKSHYRIHHALRLPCDPGRAPGQNLLMCERCGVGQYSTGSSCQGCPPGSVPSEDRDACEDCQALQYSVSGSDSCLACDLPLILVDNECVWWHLPLAAIALSALAIAAHLLFRRLRSKRAKNITCVMEEVYDELWDAWIGGCKEEGPATVTTYTEKLVYLGLQKAEIQQRFCEMRALQSERAGVSMGYLLSGEFTQLARDRTGKDDPTFQVTCLFPSWFSVWPIWL